MTDRELLVILDTLQADLGEWSIADRPDDSYWKGAYDCIGSLISQHLGRSCDEND